MQTFTGIEYLKIDVASNFGLDKKTWDERLAWFDANESKLDELIQEAETPALYFAGVQAYREMIQGNPIGYPISLDATSSGLQILAVLAGDGQAASLCNVIDSGKREDAYTLIYEHMVAQLGESAKIKRDDCKRAIMTSCYGSKSVPKEVFGEGELLTCFLDTMELAAPAVWELNKAMLAIWDPEAVSHDWVMPDNFHVHVKVMDSVSETVHFLNEPFEVIRKVNQPIKEGRSLGANMTHSVDGMIVREMSRRCSYDPDRIQVLKDYYAGETVLLQVMTKEENELTEQLWAHYEASGYLSARILDTLGSQTLEKLPEEPILELLNSLPEKPFDILSIHDCFRCHPNYGNDLRRQYNLQLHLIAKSQLLGFLVSQIVKRPIQAEKLDPNMENLILEANYSLS